MKETRPTRFALLCKSFREAYGLSYEELASKIGYSSLHLLYIEMGRRKPDRRLVETLIKFYNLEENGKRALYDAAAKALDQVPYDVIDYLKENRRAVDDIIVRMYQEKSKKM